MAHWLSNDSPKSKDAGSNLARDAFFLFQTRNYKGDERFFSFAFVKVAIYYLIFKKRNIASLLAFLIHG